MVISSSHLTSYFCVSQNLMEEAVNILCIIFIKGFKTAIAVPLGTSHEFYLLLCDTCGIINIATNRLKNDKVPIK